MGGDASGLVLAGCEVFARWCLQPGCCVADVSGMQLPTPESACSSSSSSSNGADAFACCRGYLWGSSVCQPAIHLLCASDKTQPNTKHLPDFKWVQVAQGCMAAPGTPLIERQRFFDVWIHVGLQNEDFHGTAFDLTANFWRSARWAGI